MVNVDALIGLLVSERAATLRELEEYYGTEDAYDLAEILIVKQYNDNLANQE